MCVGTCESNVDSSCVGRVAEADLESLPAKTGICILPRLSVFLWLHKQRPKIRARPAQGYFRMKDVDRRIEAITQVNFESKEEKVERAEFNVPTCGHIAVVSGAETDKFRAFSRPHPCYLR